MSVSTTPAPAFRRVTLAVLCLLVAGQVAADKPTTKPAANKPTTAPAAHYPTPAELFAQMKQRQNKEAALPKVAVFDLRSAVSEAPAMFSLFGDAGGSTLYDLLDRIRQAKDDKAIRAVLVLSGGGMNLAQAQEIRDALADVRSAGKRVFAYSDDYDTVSYTAISSATDICMLSGGEVEIPGVSISTMFYRGALDKLGIEPDYVQIGQYKGAEEPYTRTGPSDELRGELNKLIDSMYSQIVQGIASARNLSPEDVQQLVDDTMIVGDSAKDRGLVDHLIDPDGLRDLIKSELGAEADLVMDYAKPAREELDFSNPFALLALLNRHSDDESHLRPAVAVIYAEGVISDGEGEISLFGGGGIGSESMRRALRMALRDDSVKSVVLRIDSPGGSALASEAMWQAARRLAAKKPLIVSVGSEAASGGYYLACSGDYIFADPSAIVGSIGVVGGKLVFHDLFEKVGLAEESFQKGRNAGLFSSDQPWTEHQRTLVHDWMEQTYNQFTQRVLATRGKKIHAIDDVARGRIFLAAQARDLGMVDELGGTEAAIAFAAKRAHLDPGEFEVRVLPPPKTLADYLTGSGADALSPIRPNMNAALATLLGTLPQSVREQLITQLQAAKIMEHHPVLTMAPFTVHVR